MAGASLLKLLDDISSVLDDVSILTKVASKQTAGVVGDDLALNVEQCSGKNISAERELPIVFGVMWGSFINKLILIPTALLVSYYAPFLINVMLMLGGFYLSFEGGEKILGRFLSHNEENKETQCDNYEVTNSKKWEKERIKGAVKTDFVLSAEIIIIALGSVATSPFIERIMVVSIVGFIMTVGVYGFVAAIVKLDDLGLYLLDHSKGSKLICGVGSFLVNVSPWLMKLLTVIGTVAMFVVGGELIRHNIAWLEFLNQYTSGLGSMESLADAALSGFGGVVVGCTLVMIVQLLEELKK
ncbi:DUF808 domain-containing protein [Photobacterium damselae]|uniref:DUF808 domain-containing protein n=1 Tax=Photobacterium damselae TaxID=38293 RepID=UPI001F1C2F45|nr:DUF808 family protein [Photobacterium damselae]UKA04463.1 DUF808 domain-containing protein [Photobacterium damselae subsp. damselae]